MAKRPTIGELENLIAELQVELASRRATEKAARDKRLAQCRAKGKRYRLAHPDVEAARRARFQAAKTARAKAEREALTLRLQRKAQREAKAKAKAQAYQAAYYRSHRGACQPSA